ncbi:hypothetical protein P691DRAFT_787564 [Macrolepiota fuliginosa MF-IS2]|uniref:Uncharacterized protein n=1 Tax=Macrolepiota fuliginosa MF-IS2 TaxID=1400762 RepID=A0A9P6BY24_9AGAR|nr:hypothetical protein P691DRAFT_787564 [Macrolepiota fuliginosa MF-IS2]
MYIDHNAIPRAAREYEDTYMFTQPGGITLQTFNIIIDILTLGIQIWHLWIIYGATQYAIAVIIVPLLLFLCFVDATSIQWVGLLWYLVSHTADRNTGVLETSKQYMGIVAMLTESYALESAWMLAALIAEFLDNGQAAGVFFADCNVAIEIVAYLLVIYRVSSGRGWNRQTERQISTLQFQAGRNTHSATSEMARIGCNIWVEIVDI